MSNGRIRFRGSISISRINTPYLSLNLLNKLTTTSPTPRPQHLGHAATVPNQAWDLPYTDHNHEVGVTDSSAKLCGTRQVCASPESSARVPARTHVSARRLRRT